MAQFFALLLAVFQAPPAPPRRRCRSTRAGSAAFETPPAAPPGFDATTAYVPLKGGQLVAVDLNRGTIRWQLDVATAFTPATGEGLVFTVTEQTIEARDAATGADAGGERRCPAAPRRRCTGTPAGCWPRRPPAISPRSARRTARWCGGGSSARRSSAPPVPRSIASFCRSPTIALVAVLLADRRNRVGAHASPRRSPRCSRSRISWCSAPTAKDSDEHRSVARPRSMDVAARRRHGGQPRRRRQADLLRVARQHAARRRSQERQLAVEGRPVVAAGRRAAAAATTCC